MSAEVEFGVSKRGSRTLIYRNFEFWKLRENANGQTKWRCCKHEVFHCKAQIITVGDRVFGDQAPEHTHNGNVSTAYARKAIASMKEKMTETVATSSSSQGAVLVDLAPHVLMALPKRSSVSRILRRHRQIKLQAGIRNNALPPAPTDLHFDFPAKYTHMLLFDSGPGDDRLIILGDRQLLDGLARATVWLADGTFKVVPVLYFQLYTIHFNFVGGVNPAAVYCLLANKTRATYDRLLDQVKSLIPLAAPSVILTDFEAAAMQSFIAAFPNARITGCYFHLCQSVLRKVNEIGMKSEYEIDDALRESIRCLPALAHVPEDDVGEAFDLLVESMPAHDKMNELVSYFEHCYIRGRRLRGRGDNFGPALFPIPRWNQHAAAGDGIARTTNIVEGWHHGIQSLFMCSHPSLWAFFEGLNKDCHKQVASYLQATAGVEHVGTKRYRDLIVRVARAVGGYGQTDVLTYLRAIAHLSHS
jgi:hypothetical protein